MVNALRNGNCEHWLNFPMRCWIPDCGVIRSSRDGIVARGTKTPCYTRYELRFEGMWRKIYRELIDLLGSIDVRINEYRFMRRHTGNSLETRLARTRQIKKSRYAQVFQFVHVQPS